MRHMTALEQINDLWEISEYMEDEELTVALEFIAKVILKPDIPQQVITIELIKLQAISAKMAMRATYMANVDKSNRGKKNMYYTCAEQIDKVCQSLKYSLKV
jgi:hypothetical protein